MGGLRTSEGEASPLFLGSLLPVHALKVEQECVLYHLYHLLLFFVGEVLPLPCGQEVPLVAIRASVSEGAYRTF